MRMLIYISFIINQKYFILFIILIQRLDSQKQLSPITENQMKQQLFQQIQQLLQCKSFEQFVIIFEKTALGTQDQDRSEKILRSLKETLLYEQKFYQYFNKNIILGFQLLQYIFSNQKQIDQHVKKCNINIFILIAICKGYTKTTKIQKQKQKIKSFFIKSCKKTNQFWGLHQLQVFYQNLIDKSMGYFPNYSPNDCKLQIDQLKYFINFYLSTKDFFSVNLQFRTYILRMMLTLRLETNEQKQVYEILQKEYFFYEHHYQITSKNFRFIIQFFRNSFNEKECLFYPQKVVLKILAKYQTYQIQNMTHISQIGLFWNFSQLNSCLNNVIKLGLSEVSLKLFKAFIQCGLNNKKYQQLITIFQTNINKIFIFLKFQKLFSISMRFLKQMSISPSIATVGLYSKIIEKALPFAKINTFINNSQHENQYLEYLQIISVKYNDTSMTSQLKTFLQQKLNENPNLIKTSQQRIKAVLNQFQWKIGTKIQSNHKQINFLSANQKKNPNQIVYKGLVNIGNSCYMNSFLQSLYMTLELRNSLLDVSTLQLSRNVIKRLNEGSTNNNNHKQMQNLAKQSVRPAAEMQRLFALLLRSQRQSINPSAVKGASGIQFRNCYQQDTIQYGRSILQMISASSFKNIFEGEQINEIICGMCQKSRYKKQSFIDIMLTNQINNKEQQNQQAITAESSQLEQPQSQLTLQRMVKHFLKDESIQNLTCDHCEQKSSKSIKKHLIGTYPNYLILTLKRFEYDPIQKKNKKKHYQVQLKSQIINFNNQEMYEIYAIIVHRGQSANSGHYFSFCRDVNIQQFNLKQKETLDIQNIEKENNCEKMIEEKNQALKESQKLNSQVKQDSSQKRWICFNDSQVSFFQSFKSVSQFFEVNSQDTPYIIFLQKISHIKKNPCYYTMKLREPLQKFIQKDNIQYLKNLGKSPLIDWKNFGKNFKGFDYSKLRKFQQDQDDEDGNGNGGGFGFNGGNMPIL